MHNLDRDPDCPPEGRVAALDAHKIRELLVRGSTVMSGFLSRAPSMRSSIAMALSGAGGGPRQFRS